MCLCCLKSEFKIEEWEKFPFPFPSSPAWKQQIGNTKLT